MVKLFGLVRGILALMAIMTASRSRGQARPFQVASVRDLGVIGKPASVGVRDGGASGLLGGKVLWTFGDTLLKAKAVDGTNLRSNTAAWADPVHPLDVSEALDANGAPYPLLPFTAQEQAYNDSTGRPDDRFALWPQSVIAEGQDGLVFYLALKVRPGYLNYEFIGSGLATITPARTVAVREPTLLFTPPEPLFDDAMVVNSDVYVYGRLSDGAPDFPVAIGQVALTQVRERTAYRFWDGSAWVADIRAAQAVLHGIPGMLSASYNAYLGQYLIVYSEALSNRIVLRVSPRPEGPWSEPIDAFTGAAPPSESVDYAALEHPELAVNGGETIVISYFHPLGPFTGDLRLVAVSFK